MDDYRKKQQQKYLDQRKIKIEEDEQIKEKQEKLAKEKQEKINKIREEQTKKQVYIQSQMLIVDESIDSFKTDKTDDNIVMILTIIKASIENIQTMMGNDEKKVLLDQVLKFTTEVDKHNANRPKGVNTIANVQILKNGFKQIYDLLNLNIDIQTLDTENDEKIAKELEKELNEAKYPKIKHDFAEPDYDYDVDDNADVDMIDLPNVGHINHPAIRPAIQPFAPPRNHVQMHDTDSDHDHHYRYHAFVPPRNHVQMHDTDSDNDHHDHDDHEEDDETVARRMQEEWNKPQKKDSKPSRPVYKGNKYEGLSCEDFMKMLMSEKVSG